MRRLNVIGPQIRRLRYQRGWSQNKLAIRLQIAGMDHATRGKVCKIESRKVWVSDDDMLFLAYVLGVKPNDLYPTSLLYASPPYHAITAALGRFVSRRYQKNARKRESLCFGGH